MEALADYTSHLHILMPWAKVFKIARDEQGNRLTYMKITGGRLKSEIP